MTSTLPITPALRRRAAAVAASLEPVRSAPTPIRRGPFPPTVFDSESFYVTTPLQRRARTATMTLRLLALRRRTRRLRWFVAAVIVPLAALAFLAGRAELRHAAAHAPIPPAVKAAPPVLPTSSASSAVVAVTTATTAPSAPPGPAVSASTPPTVGVKATPARRRQVRRKPPNSDSNPAS